MKSKTTFYGVRVLWAAVLTLWAACEMTLEAGTIELSLVERQGVSRRGEAGSPSAAIVNRSLIRGL